MTNCLTSKSPWSQHKCGKKWKSTHSFSSSVSRRNSTVQVSEVATATSPKSDQVRIELYTKDNKTSKSCSSTQRTTFYLLGDYQVCIACGLAHTALSKEPANDVNHQERSCLSSPSNVWSNLT